MCYSCPSANYAHLQVRASLPCNALWRCLKANGWLPNGCSTSDLMLYDTVTIWKQVHEAGFTSMFSSKPLLSVAPFIKHTDQALGGTSDMQKLQHWRQQCRAALQTGLGMQTPGATYQHNKALSMTCCCSTSDILSSSPWLDMLRATTNTIYLTKCI